jgi:subtilisin family serine protease
VIGRAQVLNLSVGGEKDPAEIDVLRDVIDSGVTVVAAMGNEYEDGNPVEYPAAMPEVCAVGATDHLDRRAGFSNTGRHIDLVAPGVGILSTTPTYKYDDGQRNYDSWDGTSMATPYVAGVAALVLAKNAGGTPAQVIRRLKTSADRVAGAKKGSPSYGAGRLNCDKALK